MPLVSLGTMSYSLQLHRSTSTERRSNISKDSEGVLELDVDPGERKRILKKLDLHLIPIMFLLCTFFFLDRGNIGYVLAGFSEDLKLDALKYNIAVAIFFIPYSLVTVPQNIAMKFYRPSRWIPSIMVACGLVMTLMCLVNSYKGLLIARFFLGLAEAGLFPGVIYYISLWYPRSEQAWRVVTLFTQGTIVAGSGAFLTHSFKRMEGIGGLHAWQWTFCLEGIATVLVAFLSFFMMHDYLDTATFLTESERAELAAMIKAESSDMPTYFRWSFIWQAMRDYKTYVQISIYIGLFISTYALPLFIPTIAAELGNTLTNTDLLAIPPFVAGIFFSALVGIISDKYRIRGPFVIFGAMVSLIGYIIVNMSPNAPRVGYAGAVLAAAGAFSTIPVNLAWAGGNAGGDIKKGVVIAMVIGLGNLGGICSSFIYSDPPYFKIGHSIVSGWLCLSIIMSTFAVWDYDRINKKKEKQCEREGITADRAEEFKGMGDGSPLFRYII